MNTKSTIHVAIIGLSLILTGLLLKMGMDNFTYRDRKVTVKGLSEKVIKADLATWTYSYTANGKDMQALEKDLEGKAKIVTDFLKANGIADSCITVQPANISNDTYYNSKTKKYEFIGYSGRQTVFISSTDIDAVRKASLNRNELVFKGVNKEDSYYSRDNVEYSLKDFQTIKAEMLDEAIVNAGRSAEQFAKNSNSKIGKILVADQGTISIADNSSTTEGDYEYSYSSRSDYMKKVRVVATITYQLVD